MVVVPVGMHMSVFYTVCKSLNNELKEKADQ